MKKMLLLVSCFALILVLSNVSFAQEVHANFSATPCSCGYCDGTGSALPFAYPPYPPQKAFGGRLAERRTAKTLFAAQAFPEPLAAPAAVAGFPYPYGISDLRSRAIRRAVRLTPQPQPYPMPYPVAVPTAPLASATPPTDVSAPYAPGAVTQTGLRNNLLQRTGTSGPVINFLSVVRAPRDPFAGYPPYFPHHPVVHAQPQL